MPLEPDEPDVPLEPEEPEADYTAKCTKARDETTCNATIKGEPKPKAKSKAKAPVRKTIATPKTIDSRELSSKSRADAEAVTRCLRKELKGWGACELSMKVDGEVGLES